YAADRTIARQDRLAAPDHRRALIQQQATQLAAYSALPLSDKRIAADEIGLVQLHAETKAGLVWRIFGLQLGAPVTITLLEAQRIDTVVAACRYPKWLAGRPECVPHMHPVLGRDMQLPAQLAHIGHAQGQHGRPADSNVAGAQIWRGVVRDIVGRHRLEDITRARAPQPDHRAAGGNVVQVDRAIAFVPA